VTAQGSKPAGGASTHCDDCGQENPVGAKFCSECGLPLKKRCPSCQAENAPTAKFCNECGHALGAKESSEVTARASEARGASRDLQPQEAERRQLTVMFCDLANSTEMSQLLDPEDLRELVCSYQERCAQVVDHFGGTIAQYLGDGILVYFGYPVAHEDDALRAVRAGLGIVQAVGGMREGAAAQTPLELAVRIGVHTGAVVVGEVGSGTHREQLALGETPNIAARLQALADPNGVVISPRTHQLTRGFFHTSSKGTYELKGVEAPMEVHSVLAETGIHNRVDVDERAHTPYVGRETELKVMTDAWEAARAGRGQALLVTGEAGIGKSRFTRTFKDHAASGADKVHEAYCSPYFGNSAFYPILELLRSRAGFTRDDTNRQRLANLRAYLATMKMERGEAVPLLASMLAIPPDAGFVPLNLSPQAQRHKALEILTSILLHSSSAAPTLIVIEDIHWADPSTLDLLNLMVARAPERRALLVLTTRPGFASAWSASPHLHTIVLESLPPQQTQDLIVSITGGREIPPRLMSQLMSKTDGNPLYIEEMTKMILEAGFQAGGATPQLSIPTTLHDSLMARLDRMEPWAKKVAQLGACIGREFIFDLLRAVLPEQDGALRGGLSRLVEAELVFGPSDEAAANYSFKHALIQDAAYESLLKRTRQQYHERIAQAIERDLPDLVARQPEQIAQHYTRAARADKAVPYWLVAGKNAVASSANAEAANHLKEGLKLVESLPPSVERDRQEVELLSTLGTALSALQGYASAEVRGVYLRAQQLCESIGPTPQHFWVLWGLWAFYLVGAEHKEAVAVGDKMMSLARQEKNLSWELEAHFSIGLSFFFMGNLAPAREHLERAVAIYEVDKHHANAQLNIQDVGVTSRSVAALCLFHLGEIDLAVERSHQALELADKLGHPFSKAYALGCAAWFNLYMRDAETALRHARAAIDLSTEQGFLWWQIWGTVLGGRALADVEPGEASASVAQIRGGIDFWKQTGSRFTIPYFLALQAEASAKGGETDAALALIAEARGLIESTGEGFFAGELWRLEGELLRAKGGARADAIEKCFERALDIARSQGAKAFELRAATALARLWKDGGRSKDARAVLSRASAGFEGRTETQDMREARALFEALEGVHP